jgi:hypothetical protein
MRVQNKTILILMSIMFLPVLIMTPTEAFAACDQPDAPDCPCFYDSNPFRGLYSGCGDSNGWDKGILRRKWRQALLPDSPWMQQKIVFSACPKVLQPDT